MLHSSSAAAGNPRSAARTKPKNFKAKLKKALPTLFLLAFAALFAVFPDRYVPVCLDGIALWALNVLPAVFPFLFVTALLRASGGAQRVSRVFSPFAKVLFGTGGEGGFCFFMSILSGYPVGASLVSAFKADGVFSDDEAQILACACSTSGPLFVIGSVGAGMFSDKKSGSPFWPAHLRALCRASCAHHLRRRAENETLVPSKAQGRGQSFPSRNAYRTPRCPAIGVGGCYRRFTCWPPWPPISDCSILNG
ncbi:MAG: nucleoside recognition domain-containing protein [Christensenellaceae bacterium]